VPYKYKKNIKKKKPELPLYVLPRESKTQTKAFFDLNTGGISRKRKAIECNENKKKA